jgi:hypothetical protein
MKLSYFDIEELVRGMDDLDDDADIDQHLFDKYEVGFDEFSKIVCALLPLVVISKSALTETVYKGFGKDGLFLLKIKA